MKKASGSGLWGPPASLSSDSLSPREVGGVAQPFPRPPSAGRPGPFLVRDLTELAQSALRNSGQLALRAGVEGWGGAHDPVLWVT